MTKRTTLLMVAAASAALAIISPAAQAHSPDVMGIAGAKAPYLSITAKNVNDPTMKGATTYAALQVTPLAIGQPQFDTANILIGFTSDGPNSAKMLVIEMKASANWASGGAFWAADGTKAKTWTAVLADPAASAPQPATSKMVLLGSTALPAGIVAQDFKVKEATS